MNSRMTTLASTRGAPTTATPATSSSWPSLGWALASFDANLLSLTLPDITEEFGLSGGLVGTLGFVVYGAEFLLALFVGYGMDRKGRRWMWMFCLTAGGAADRA